MTTRTTHLAIGGLLALALVAPAAAQTEYHDYDDWHLSIETIDTGEDLRVSCRIGTGGDGDPSLSVEISNGDGGPPDYYPDVVLSESAPRGHDTMMQDGETVHFITDSGQGFQGAARRWIEDDTFAVAEAAIDQSQSLFALEAMASGGVFEISTSGGMVYTASFHGFRDAYSHMMQACGFSDEGVIVVDDTVRAETLYFEYRDWMVTVQDFSSWEHDLIVCSARTGGDGQPVLSVDTEMRDGEPPYGLPSIFVTETPPRGHDSVIQQDAPVHITFDDGDGRSAKGGRWIEDDGMVFAQAAFFEHDANLALLRGMRRNRTVFVASGNRAVFNGSLLGFTAAYGKMAEQCNFSAANVID